MTNYEKQVQKMSFPEAVAFFTARCQAEKFEVEKIECRRETANLGDKKFTVWIHTKVEEGMSLRIMNKIFHGFQMVAIVPTYKIDPTNRSGIPQSQIIWIVHPFYMDFLSVRTRMHLDSVGRKVDQQEAMIEDARKLASDDQVCEAKKQSLLWFEYYCDVAKSIGERIDRLRQENAL